MEEFSLRDKTAVVTGCSGGIGAGIALGLARAGAGIAGMDIRDMGETAAGVRELGRKFDSFHADLSHTDEIADTWERILETVGGVDILVNNAGIQFRQSALSYPLDMFDRMLAINLRAGYQLSQLAANHFCNEKKRGKIINLASLFSAFGGMDVSGYTCSKHGVVGMTKALSNEFAGRGICVNAIAPGYIATELTKSIWGSTDKSSSINERIPAGRWGTPSDFAGPAVFLASEASDYITGIVLPVDGGYAVR